MTSTNCSKAKYIAIGLLFVVCVHFSFGQNIRSISVTTSLVNQTDNLKLKGQYGFSSCSGNISFNFIYDSLERKLLKVIVKDTKDLQPKEYYFSNDELIFIKSSWGKSYFSEIDFSVGSTWKNENDTFLINREREMAAAYRFLVLHKNREASQYAVNLKTNR